MAYFHMHDIRHYRHLHFIFIDVKVSLIILLGMLFIFICFQKTYGVRIIYAGEHTLRKEDIAKHFKLSVKAVNASYCDLNIRGFLLVYDRYFVHILEV